MMYAEKPIGKLSAKEVELHAVALSVKISIITGWQLPEDAAMQNILYDQLAKKMKEDYSNLNIQEIEYAMRKYGTEIKDWGKSINLAMIDSAVNPYFYSRITVRQLEESQLVVKQIEQPVEPLDNDAFIQTVKDTYLKTKITGLIPVKVFDLLQEQKEIDLTLEEKTEIRARVEAAMESEAMQGGLQEMKNLRALRENKREYEIKVRNECKKHAVGIYFIKQHEMENF